MQTAERRAFLHDTVSTPLCHVYYVGEYIEPSQLNQLTANSTIG